MSTDVPEPAIEGGLNTAVTNGGRPVTPRLTVPVKPCTAATEREQFPLLSRRILALAGDAETKKSLALTTRVTRVECEKVPLVPLMVSVYVPCGVVVAVVTASVVEPDPVNDAG